MSPISHDDDVPSHEGPSEYSPVSDTPWEEYSYMHNPQLQRPESDEPAPYNPTRTQYLLGGFRNGYAMGFVDDSDSEAVLSDSASDDGEEEEELMDVPSPRDSRAARRSTLRRAFHLTLLFLLTVIIPGDATDAVVAPSIQARRLQRFFTTQHHTPPTLRLTVQLSTYSTSVGFLSLGSMCFTDCALASWVHSSCSLRWRCAPAGVQAPSQRRRAHILTSAL
jgi:hypothetical protein